MNYLLGFELKKISVKKYFKLAVSVALLLSSAPASAGVSADNELFSVMRDRARAGLPTLYEHERFRIKVDGRTFDFEVRDRGQIRYALLLKYDGAPMPVDYGFTQGAVLELQTEVKTRGFAPNASSGTFLGLRIYGTSTKGLASLNVALTADLERRASFEFAYGQGGYSNGCAMGVSVIRDYFTQLQSQIGGDCDSQTRVDESGNITYRNDDDLFKLPEAKQKWLFGFDSFLQRGDVRSLRSATVRLTKQLH